MATRRLLSRILNFNTDRKLPLSVAKEFDRLKLDLHLDSKLTRAALASRLIDLEEKAQEEFVKQQQQPTPKRKFPGLLFGTLAAALISFCLLRFSSSVMGALESEEFFEEWDSTGRKKIPGQTEGGRKSKNVKFDDVIGCEEALTDLQDILDFLKNPKKYEAMDLRLPRGVLMSGPPGCGKTLIARALAGEAGVPILTTTGSNFDQIFVGLGSMRIRRIFNRAKALAPCVIFIDEIDSVASQRNARDQKFANQTINQLLSEMDGFTQSSGIIVIGATNRADVLDKAILRPGRFDRVVQVGLPHIKEREQILNLYLKHNGGVDVDTVRLAATTPGCSGADLEHLVNLAGIESVKHGENKISMARLEEAKDTVLMGRSRKLPFNTPADLKLTSYHECGHTLVNLYTKGSKPLYKVTILPRGQSLGMTNFQATESVSESKETLLASLDTAVAGRVAEELLVGNDKITTGASNDFKTATDIAFYMVTRLGMSDKIGHVYYDDATKELFSETTKAEINLEVKLMLDQSLDRVRALLKKRTKQLEKLAAALYEKETLTETEVKEIIGYNPSEREPPANTESSPFKIPRSTLRSPVSTPTPIPRPSPSPSLPLPSLTPATLSPAS